MTFKTDIKFYESPVLRSLERVAVNKGLIKPDPVIKQASKKESFLPSNNLDDDMLMLVAGLRNKGFDKEADALEDKINIRKLAETHLYRVFDEDGEDVLNFAHPEGDVEIAQTASGLGKVWTEQSAQKQNLKTVLKQPTGKLGYIKTDLKKTAQSIDVDKINAEIASLWADLENQKKKAITGLGAGTSWWRFDPSIVLSDAKTESDYIKRTGLAPKSISDLKRLMKISFGSYNLGSSTDIYNRISSSLQKSLSNLNAWHAATNLVYFYGSSNNTSNNIVNILKDKPMNKPWSRHNDQSVINWNGDTWQVNAQTASTASEQVYKLVSELYNSVFGENLAKASQASINESLEFVKLVNSSFGSMDPKPYFVHQDESGSITQSIVKSIQGIRIIKRRIRRDLSKAFKKRYSLLVENHKSSTKMDWSNFDSAISVSLGVLGQIDNLLSPFAQGDPLRQAAKLFKRAGSIMMRYANTFTPEEQSNDPEYKQVVDIINRSYEYTTKILNAINKGETTSVLGKTGPELLEGAKQWLARVIDVTGYDSPAADDTSYADDNFSKEAKQRGNAGKGGEGSFDPFKVKLQKYQRGSGKKQNVGSSTSAIQQELLNLADLIEEYKGLDIVISKLRMEPHGKDNIWGDSTESALQYAEAIRKKYKIQSPAITTSNSMATAKAIKDMIKAIKDGKWERPPEELEGGASEEYDKYPDKDGAILTSKDLGSLYNFYTWLIENAIDGWSPKERDGFEIVSIQDLTFMIKKIAARAKAWFNATTAEGRKIAIKYFRAISRLYREWVELLQQKAKETNGTLQDPYILVNNLATSGGISGSRSQLVGGRGKDNRKNRRIGEGTEIEMIGGERGRLPGGSSESDYPPITRYIDLSEKSWWDTDRNDLLDFHVIERMSGVNFAATYFSQQANPNITARDIIIAARNAGYPQNYIRYDQKTKDVIVWIGSRWARALNDPNVVRQLTSLKGQDSNTRALNFIRSMRAEISRVLRDWQDTITSPSLRRKLIPLVVNNARSWQRKFMRMENDLGRSMTQTRRSQRG